METLVWYEDWGPDLTQLHQVGRAVAADLTLEEAQGLWTLLTDWLSAPEIQGRLRRDHYPAGAEALTEEAFAVRLEDALYEGRIDRLVLVKDGGLPRRAEVLDYKTDRIAPQDKDGLARAARAYRGQLRVYREAVAQLYDLPLASVQGALVFLGSGAVVGSEE